MSTNKKPSRLCPKGRSLGDPVVVDQAIMRASAHGIFFLAVFLTAFFSLSSLSMMGLPRLNHIMVPPGGRFARYVLIKGPARE